MALIKKLGAKKVVSTKPTLALPTEPNEPSSSLSDYSILLYGVKKGGKTSLASRFPDAFFLSLEPGTKALRVFQRDVRDWEEFVGYIDLLEKTKQFKTIIVDTIDLAYEYAWNYICKKKMIDHPRDENDYGATWKEIKNLFAQQCSRLLNLGRGVIFISHDMEKEIELRDGTKIHRVQPTMANQALAHIEAVVDVICNYGFEGKRRILTMDGNQNVVAGCRLEEHFIRAGGEPRVAGDRIITIDMGNSAQEAYDNFLRAFNNQQEVVDVTAVAKAKPGLKKPLVLKKGK